LNRPSQQLLEISDETSGKPGCRLTDHIDEQVHVALARVLTARYRAEEEHISRAMVCGDLKNLIAAFSDARASAHLPSL
jgi:hypothetical protein